MSALKLSIIIPVYNVEKYLEKCLNSLCGLKIENEIIIINDGTKDSSLEIAEKFKKNHKNENILIISQENQGLSEARNNGMKIAKGEYISFIDSDDFVDTGNYEKFVNEVIKDNVDIGIGRYKKIIEKIDIGGISLIRAGAKNFKDVVIVPSKAEYGQLLDILKNNGAQTELEERRTFAAKAFGVSSRYDTAIHRWFEQ